MRPLIELHFSADTRNTGTLGGEASLIEYVPGEGPVFGPGRPGTGLDLTASSRGGGTHRTKAGGAAVVDAPSLGALQQVTIALWCNPDGPNAPARLISLGSRADVSISDGALGFKVRHKGADVSFTTSRTTIDIVPGQWHFLALTHDAASGQARLFHTLPGGIPSPAATWSNVPLPDATSAHLEIGNLGGIRPFRGLVDGVRIYDSVLSADQIAAIAASDEPPFRPLTHSLLSAPVQPAFFRPSDVCLTSRTKHTNSVETLKAFRANRLLWSYAHDAEFADALRDAGAETFQGTINSLPGTSETAAHALDFDGRPMVAPWMRAFSKKSPVFWGCNNRPRFMEVCLDRAKAAIAAGATMLQFDDWALIASASGWGGACFCEQCMAAFPDDIRAHLSAGELAQLGIPKGGPFDYRAYLAERHGITNAAAYMAQKKTLPTTPHFESFHRRSIRAFFQRLDKAIAAIAGHRVPMSINANFSRPSQSQAFLTDIVDFLQGETLHFTPDPLALAAKCAESLGKWHVFVSQSLDVPDARAGIATIYALGQLPMIPWDMYMGSDETSIQPRGWGTVDQYGDLFHFARGNPGLFDGFGSVATVGLIVDLDHFDRTRTLRACRRLLDAQVPFAVIPVGHEYYDVPLRAERLATFDALALCANMGELAGPDRAALVKAAAATPLLDPERAADSALAPFSIAEVWGPREIHVIARARPRAADRTLLLHIINRASPNTEIKWLSFLLRPRAFLGPQIASVRWHAPGQPTTDLERETLPGGTRILIPRVREWGIAEIEF